MISLGDLLIAAVDGQMFLVSIDALRDTCSLYWWVTEGGDINTVIHKVVSKTKIYGKGRGIKNAYVISSEAE